MKIANSLDLQKNSILNGVIHVLASDPATPAVGQIYYNSATEQLLIRGASAWSLKATDAALLNGQNAAFYLARGNHTGTQTASTISDLETVVQAYRLNQFAMPTASVNLNGQRIMSLAEPTTGTDAVTRNYVDTQVQNAAAGIDSKPSVKVVAVANITLSGTQTIDGVSCVVGDRVLAVGQTTASQNGVYVVAAGVWARALEADQTGEITTGATWFVEQGTTYGSTTWRTATIGTITIGTTSISITQLSAGANYTASLGVQLVGNDIRAQVVANGGIQAVAGGLQVDTAVVVRKFSATVGNGSLTSIPVTHNLGTKDVTVSTRFVSNDEMFLVDWTATDANTVTLTFAAAPASNSVRVVIHA